MASGEAKKLVKYLQELGICKNLLLFRTLEENFQAFLTDVKVPSGFADNDFNTNWSHITKHINSATNWSKNLLM